MNKNMSLYHQASGVFKSLLLGLSLSAAGLTVAQAAVINGVNFEAVYRGSELPSNANPSWSMIGTQGIPDADTEIYTLSTTGTQSGYSQRTWNLNSFAGVTVELRAKIQQDAGTRAANDVRLFTGSRLFIFNLSMDKVFFGNTVEEESSYTVDNGVFHTYRITLSDSGSGIVATVYLDNAETPIITGYAGAENATSGKIQWGDAATSGSSNGVVDWNYVAYTTEGAFAPIPEPAATALIGLGLGIGALGYHWKRNRK